ncbi:hypothetical protein ACIA8G_36645 [Lentzea sp. NPDC051213]|uniref:hypothetical protein n=1 Tax=Lentzea sp. NPDC051213 TaxID=3364126 RepID=UPI00379C83E7
MTLSMDMRDHEVRHYRCECCQEPIDRVWNWVHRDAVGRAMYFANRYHHTPREVVIDVVLGTWTRYDHPDHITFGCRVDSDGGRALVDPLGGRSGAPVNGQVIAAEGARSHPLVAEFWEVVEFVLTHDPYVSKR